MEIVSGVIGVIGFIIAVYTFYETQIKRAKIEIIVGPNITVYYTQDGGSGIYLPLAFVNEGHKSAKIINIYLQISTPSKKVYKIRWADFVKWNSSERNFNHIDHCRAFSVSGSTVNDKFVWFIWRPQNESNLLFEEGEYKVSILYDNSPNPNNQLKAFDSKFHIDYEDAKFLKSQYDLKETKIRKILINNNEKENELIK